ncbi:Hypothetical_protein [Hexamita inflata]|uniref:Hypothetical_protein n=1 Tax=Hexamita inflata TaxID=28002 RepID=A0AA86UW17_9EUKA|nr:Hypothetical protein HINF_LOCUS57824 [Hexamita inflata]
MFNVFTELELEAVLFTTIDQIVYMMREYQKIPSQTNEFEFICYSSHQTDTVKQYCIRRAQIISVQEYAPQFIQILTEINKFVPNSLETQPKNAFAVKFDREHQAFCKNDGLLKFNYFEVSRIGTPAHSIQRNRFGQIDHQIHITWEQSILMHRLKTKEIFFKAPMHEVHLALIDALDSQAQSLKSNQIIVNLDEISAINYLLCVKKYISEHGEICKEIQKYDLKYIYNNSAHSLESLLLLLAYQLERIQFIQSLL